MFVVTHRIAGLVFRTESSVSLPSLLARPFVDFLAGNEVVPDVRHLIHKVPSASIEPAPLTREEQDALLQGAQVSSDAHENPLLRFLAVQNWLRSRQTLPESQVLIGQDCVVGHDFARHVLDFFYMEEPVRTPEPVEWVRMGDEADLEPCFRIRVVDCDPARAAHLTDAERERFIQNITFLPPEVVDHPLLRTPTLKSWLLESLERGETIQAGPFLDGVLVWNREQQALDFFYFPQFGEIQEKRVADYYRRMFAAFLPGFSALMVHSSGVIRGDRAALFLAQDEGGKTTVLRQATDSPWLNDDQVILRQEGDGFVAHGTPLGWLTSGPCQAPLGAFFVLEKARSFDLEPIRPAALVQYLWEGHQFYTSTLPRSLKMRAFDLFYKACHQVPAYTMRFPKDYVDWQAIDAAMSI